MSFQAHIVSEVESAISVAHRKNSSDQSTFGFHCKRDRGRQPGEFPDFRKNSVKARKVRQEVGRRAR